jgi:hypothetical protein
MALNAANIRVGAARIYMNVTAPAVGQALALSDEGVPPDGQEVGLTEGESVFTYEVTFMDINAEQSLSPVAVFATEEKATIQFTMKEMVNANIQDFLYSLVEVTENVSASPGGETDIFEGGRTCAGAIPLQSVTLVTPSCDGPAPNLGANTIRFEYVMLFKAYQSEAASLRFAKAGDQLMKVTFMGIADVGRADGSTLFTLGVERWAS